MEPQERDLITTLLTRLQSAGGQPKDAEADAMIRQAMTQMPDAPYYLVQTVLIQDLSLHNAQNRIAELEKQVATLAPPQQPASFLGGLFGRSQAAPASVPPSGPWTRAPQAAPPPPPGYGQPNYAQPGYAQPGYAQPAPAPAAGLFGGGGNSFLRSAATTAAGVAGGALLFEGISSLFGHGYASGLGGFGGMGMGGMGMGGGLSETVINNNYGGGDGGYAGGDSGYAGGDGGYAGGDGNYGGGGDGGGYDGGGGDSGGGGDFGGGDSGGGGDSSSC